MDELIQRLVNDGHEVTFRPDPGGRGTECVITSADGDVTTAVGATPADALASAAAEPGAGVVTDSGRDCTEANPGSGAWCHKSGPHKTHRDTDGETWQAGAA